ncbi:hypothetical protein BDQ12DRAFT_496562 [Crucibulum laeve]|uniref:CHAT domain-containing protein n=1 Tax=Crucibulum laeve TaxID=68775 RepID=A0A5C3MGZ0_9AGAR|nr:hypothetical protein BDQ12DRAFT_496562 [Crucibulum laeve]
MNGSNRKNTEGIFEGRAKHRTVCISNSYSLFYFHDGCVLISCGFHPKRIPQADIAFLSACETSTGDKILSKEAIHPSAEMLSTSYKSAMPRCGPNVVYKRIPCTSHIC